MPCRGRHVRRLMRTDIAVGSLKLLQLFLLVLVQLAALSRTSILSGGFGPLRSPLCHWELGAQAVQLGLSGSLKRFFSRVG